METMINLNDLLKHEIMDLYSVEEQIIEAMPAMIEKAKNPELKKALREHLKITEEQKSRLDKIKQTFGEGDGQGNGEGENKGFFSRLFGGGNGGEKCKGMDGIITEGEKIMAADITDEALDAAIIASAQKIEHYEISGYGTARAYARELRLQEVERLLAQTLNEEYEADDRLTSLAVGKLNLEAEKADGMEGGGGSKRGGSKSGGSKGGSSKSGGSKSGGSSKGGGSKSGGSKGGSSKGGGSKSGGSKGGSSKGGGGKSGGGSKGGGSKSGGKSGGSKGGSSKGGGKSGGGSKGGNKGGGKGGGRR